MLGASSRDATSARAWLLALAALLVCMGMGSTGHASAKLRPASADVVALDRAGTDGRAPPREASVRQEAGAQVAPEAIASDLGKEDPPCDDAAASALERPLGPRELPRGWRRESASDPWRVSRGTGFARGPPTA